MITDIELKKLQNLARISFKEDEIESFKAKLETVIGMIDKLHDEDCSNVEPLRSVCESTQRLQADAVNVGDIANDIFANVTGAGADLAKKEKLFVVPKVVE